MSTLISLISDYSGEIIPILGGGEAVEKYTRIDLSVDNLELAGVDITNPDACQNYIDLVLDRNDAMVAYGGYLEKRNLYADKADFSGEGQPTRNIHLGIDFCLCDP